jgi:hypothetical protein
MHTARGAEAIIGAGQSRLVTTRYLPDLDGTLKRGLFGCVLVDPDIQEFDRGIESQVLRQDGLEKFLLNQCQFTGRGVDLVKAQACAWIEDRIGGKQSAVRAYGQGFACQTSRCESGRDVANGIALGVRWCQTDRGNQPLVWPAASSHTQCKCVVGQGRP